MASDRQNAGYTGRQYHHNNNGRGNGKRGRGGYNGNKYRNQDDRDPFYGYYCPRSQGIPKSYAKASPPTGRPTPWAVQYGGYPVSPSGHMAHMPNPNVPSTFYSGLPTTNAQPQYGVPVNSHALPPRPPPFASQTVRIALPSTDSIALSNTDSMADPNYKKSGIKPKDLVLERETATSKKLGASVPPTPRPATAATSNVHVFAPDSTTPTPSAPKYTQKTAHRDHDSQISPHQYIPNEGHTQPMDAAHSNPNNTVNLLNHETIMELQIFNITLAAKLKGNLKQAKASYEAEDAVYTKKRSIVLGLLQHSLQTERRHDAVVRHMYDRFHEHMTDACARDGEDKAAAQVKATTQLKSASDVSRLAAEERNKVDKYRDDLHQLDNARAISRKVYSDTVHDNLMLALSCKNLDAHVKEVQKSTDKAASALGNSTDEQKDRQDSGAVTSSYTHQHGTQQGVIENLPEVERPSISEVLSRVNTVQAGENLNAPPQTKEQPTMASVVNRPVRAEVVQKAIGVTLDAPTLYANANVADLKKPQVQNDHCKGSKKKAVKGKELVENTKDDDNNVADEVVDKMDNKVANKMENKMENKVENKVAEKIENEVADKIENKAPAKPTSNTAQGAEEPGEGLAYGSKAHTDKPAHEFTGRKKYKKNNNKKKGGGDGNAAGDGKGNNQLAGGASEASRTAGPWRKGG